MTPSHFLERFWLGVAAHLWQTSLVLAVLFFLGWLMRKAPARMLNHLWWLGLAKLFLPLPILGVLGRNTLQPLLKSVVSIGGAPVTLSPWLGKASGLLDPTASLASSVGRQPILPQWVLAILTCAWIAAVFWFGIRWGRSRRPSLVRSSIPLQAAAPELQRRLLEAIRGTRIRSGTIRVAQDSSVPAVGGLFRPRITIPDTLILALEPSELRGVLLHEDEHCRRLDPLRLAIQKCAIAAFFYYPLLWPLLDRLHASGEIACDEAVVQAGVPPDAYAKALAHTLKLGLLPTGTPAIAGSQGKTLIRRRFRRLAQSRRYIVMTKHRFALALGILCVALFSFLPFSPPASAEIEDDVKMPTIIPSSCVLPEYPETAREAGIEARVLLEVVVTEKGDPGEVRAIKLEVFKPKDESAEKISEEDGAGDRLSFGKNAVKAVRKWKFEPASKNGEPVEMTVQIPVEYRLGDKDKGEADNRK